MEDLKLLDIDLSVASQVVIEILLEDSSEPQVFKDILAANRGRPDILKTLVDSPNVPQEILEEAGRIINLPVRSGRVPLKTHEKPEHEQAPKQSLLNKIQTLSIGEKIHIALLGGRDIRSALSKDSNKEVVLTVLKNPKITESEVEMFARSRNVPEEVMRVISKNREWMKKYNITTALVNNPKTPPGISSALLSTLKTKDLVALEYNKNVPDAVRASAKRMLDVRRKH